MQTILTQASQAALQAILKQPADNAQRYSQFPVHEQEFWETLFAAARNPKKAQQVLNEIEVIEAEPCIDNDRVWSNVRAVRSLARMSLLQTKRN
jgi:hypothetical protein